MSERLPYLLRSLKAPRIAERLSATAERARAESWPYEQFLEALLEAEGFAREASGDKDARPARRVPAAQDAGGLRLGRAAVGGAPAGTAPGPAGLDLRAR